MNLIESLLSAEFIRAFAWTLFHSLWQGGLLALVAFGLMIILRKHRPAIRYMILYTVLMLLPVFFAGTFLMTYNPGNVDNNTKVANAGSSWNQENALNSANPGISEDATKQAWYSHPAHVFENQAKWLVLIWFAGFFIFLLRFSGSILYVYRLKNYQVYSVDEHWNTNLNRLSGRIGLHQQVKLAESALARIPMTIGYLKPVILLPLGTLSGIPPQQIDAILLHELSHIMRKDYLMNIIQSVIELLFFYHPVTWWLSGLIRQEREHICDDLAISVNQDHINYIKALTTMEEINSKSPLLASAMMGSKKKLLFRVKRLLNPVKLRKGLGEGIIAFILLIGLVSTLSLNALSIIPSTYDLTGRESGEHLFNFLPFNPNEANKAVSQIPASQPAVELTAIPETPDTIIATSKSGKVKISVYTDSTSQAQQEMLTKMAEAMDAQNQHINQQLEDYIIQVETSDADEKKYEKQCKVMVIRDSDSTSSNGDSIIVIYSDSRSPFPGNQFEFELPPPPPGCPLPPHAQEFRYFYSDPEIPDEKIISTQVYAIKNDLIDTVIIIGPEEYMDPDKMKEFEWNEDQLNEGMKDYEINIEREYRDAEREYSYAGRGFAPEQPPMPSPEKIIRQELRDDGLTMRGRRYVIELDSKSMYINGEKQPKEVYRKYRKLVDSFEPAKLEGDETFKLIF
jgi:bla regulator protein blaR1